MTMRMQTLASGHGWRVSDVLCSSGPHERPFGEQHTSVCIAAVMQGSFEYRSVQGVGTLVPGAVLLGNHQTSFECGHDHSSGDRCLSFAFEPAFFDTILSSVPGVRRAGFDVPGLPPSLSLAPTLAAAELAWIENDPVWFEQLALDLAGQAAAMAADSALPRRTANRRDRQRIAGVVRRIEADVSLSLTIADLARQAAMSP